MQSSFRRPLLLIGLSRIFPPENETGGRYNQSRVLRNRLQSAILQSLLFAYVAFLFSFLNYRTLTRERTRPGRYPKDRRDRLLPNSFLSIRTVGSHLRRKAACRTRTKAAKRRREPHCSPVGYYGMVTLSAYISGNSFEYV